MTFKVEVVIDDEDYSYYDIDDKQRHYFQTKRVEIERDTTATISALAHIINKDDYDEEFEVLEINMDTEKLLEFASIQPNKIILHQVNQSYLK